MPADSRRRIVSCLDLLKGRYKSLISLDSLNNGLQSALGTIIYDFLRRILILRDFLHETMALVSLAFDQDWCLNIDRSVLLALMPSASDHLSAAAIDICPRNSRRIFLSVRPIVESLDVEPQEVVPGETESTDRWLEADTAMRTEPVIAVKPSGQFGAAFV